MSSKRTPINRSAAWIITEEILEWWRIANKLAPKRWACISDDVCDSDEISRHCPDCLAQMDATRNLNRAFGVKLWEYSPVDVSDTPPDQPDRRAGWERSLALRRALEQAAKEQRKAKRLAKLAAKQN